MGRALRAPELLPWDAELGVLRTNASRAADLYVRSQILRSGRRVWGGTSVNASGTARGIWVRWNDGKLSVVTGVLSNLLVAFCASLE